jgi:hypothetical protein
MKQVFSPQGRGAAAWGLKKVEKFGTLFDV